MQTPRIHVVRHDSPQMRFELAFAVPLGALRMYVREYVGWVDRTATAVRRLELPSGNVPLIINFNSKVRERKAHADHWTEHGTFTAGLHDAFTIVESSGPDEGIQVNFTAAGARLFYDRPLDDFANRTVELDDVFGSSASRLVARLYEATSWETRFDILDREIDSRIVAARRPASAVIWAWNELVRTGGRVRIADLVREIRWSERHFAVQFRREVGLAPKSFARVLRFSAAVRLMTRGRASNLADVAHACGYADQAHFTRDFRAFAGTTPTALLESRLPGHAGYGVPGSPERATGDQEISGRRSRDQEFLNTR